MRDPVTKLALVDPKTIDRELCKSFSDLLIPRADRRVAVLYYMSRVQKRTRRGFTDQRVLFATNTHLYECKEDGSRKRSIPYTLIEGIMLFSDQHIWCKIPKQHDLVFKLDNPGETAYFVNVMSVARSFLGGMSAGIAFRSIAASLKDSPEQPNLTKRDGVDNTIAEVAFIREIDERENAVEQFLRPPPPPKQPKDRQEAKPSISEAEKLVLKHPLLDPNGILPTGGDGLLPAENNVLLSTRPLPNLNDVLEGRAPGGGNVPTESAKSDRSAAEEAASKALQEKEAEIDAKSRRLMELQKQFAEQQSSHLEAVSRFHSMQRQHQRDQAQLAAGQTSAISEQPETPSQVSVRWGDSTAKKTDAHGIAKKLDLAEPQPLHVDPQPQEATPPPPPPQQAAAPPPPPVQTASPLKEIVPMQAELSILRDELTHAERMRAADATELERRHSTIEQMRKRVAQLDEENRQLRSAPTRSSRQSPDPAAVKPQLAAGPKIDRGMSVADFEASVKHKELSERLVLRQHQIDQKRSAARALLQDSNGSSYDTRAVAALQEEMIELVKNLEADVKEAEATQPVEEEPAPVAPAPQQAQPAFATYPPPGSSGHTDPKQQAEYAQWYYTHYYPYLLSLQNQNQGRQQPR